MLPFILELPKTIYQLPLLILQSLWRHEH